ncbi:MAG: hypothetical protein OXI25_06450 [Chloroflexota bacterium]|nr:hypothetical protein [Chloroflexota bacterium]
MAGSLKAAVFDAVIALAGEFDDLHSFLSVGSHADRDKPEELHNDYDFLYVFDDLTWPRYRLLRSRLDAVAARLSTPEHLVYVDDRLGPVKPQGPTPKLTMIQPLLFDRASFRDYIRAAPFLTLDWARFPVLRGLPLTAYGAIGFPTVELLLDARAGVRHYREMAREQTIIALAPVERNGRVGRERQPLPVTPDLLLELHHAVVTRTMTNALMVFARDNSGVKGAPLVERFTERFPTLAPHAPFALDLIVRQARLRAGEQPVYDDTDGQRRAVNFLDAMESFCLEK